MWKKIQFLSWWKLVLCGKEGKETGQDGSSMPDGYNYIRKWNIQGKIRRRPFRINGTFRLKYDATLLRDRPFNSWGRGWGYRVGDFWSSRIFFSSNLVGRIFFSLFLPSAFYYICAACKRLQEIFFQNHPPPASRVKWSAPKTRLILEQPLTPVLR